MCTQAQRLMISKLPIAKRRNVMFRETMSEIPNASARPWKSYQSFQDVARENRLNVEVRGGNGDAVCSREGTPGKMASVKIRLDL